MESTITCEHCGKEHTYTHTKATRRKRRFCPACRKEQYKLVRATDVYVMDKELTVECAICGAKFTYVKHSVTGKIRSLCDECKRELAVQHTTAYRVRVGTCKQPGVGSGNADNNKAGTKHHSYTSGNGIYRRLAKDALPPERWVCEVCGATQSDNRKDPDKPLPLCVHHKDGNHYNNSPDNWMVLCKRCHQDIHNCAQNLEAYNAEVKLRKESGNSSSGQSDLKATVTSSQGQRLESDA